MLRSVTREPRAGRAGQPGQLVVGAAKGAKPDKPAMVRVVQQARVVARAPLEEALAVRTAAVTAVELEASVLAGRVAAARVAAVALVDRPPPTEARFDLRRCEAVESHSFSVRLNPL